MKKVVIFGGGSGLSQILKGLKMFPIDVTAVVSVFDNGRSTGKLRKEMHIPAVGDITKVMLSMSNVDNDIIDLMNYRFTKSKTLGNHSIKNLLLTALLDIKGNFAQSLPILEDLLDIEKGKIIPLTEDSVNLVGITKDNKVIVGEEQITKAKSKIEKITYDGPITINPAVISAIREADLIIFSSGSLYTSIIPHIVSKDIVKELNNTKAEKLYICNLFTQPGETDNLTVSQHIEVFEKYLGKDSIDIVVANSEPIKDEFANVYSTKEQKDPVKLDQEALKEKNIYLIADNLYKIEDGYCRHDALKTAYLIFSYLMDGRQ